MPSPSPIVLFVYRRPEHAGRILDCLRQNPEAASSNLFIFSDGPKNVETRPSVASVRELCREVRGFASVTLVERAENWGLAKSVIAGVTEICASHGRVIVLEDDLVVSPHFLAYMNEALERYAADDRVYQISGYQFPIAHVGQHDAEFMPFTTSWGWATWQRAWAHFDPGMSGFTRLQADPELKRAFNFDGAFPGFKMLQDQLRGQVDSWAIRWYLSVFLEKGLTLFPARTLVENGGRDGSGTHGGDSLSSEPLDTEFKVNDFPSMVEIDSRVHRAIIRHLNGRKPLRLARLVSIFAKIARIYPWWKQRRFMVGVRALSIMGEDSVIFPPGRVINFLNDPEAIMVGNHCRIRGDLVIFGNGGLIQIGDYCFLGENSRIWSSRSVKIGNRVLIAHNVMIMDNISHPIKAEARHQHFRAIITGGHPVQIDLKERPIVIQDDAWIGCMSVILPGVTIGRGAIIGAGSVVTKNVPPWSLVAGNPAQVVRKLSDESNTALRGPMSDHGIAGGEPG